MEKMDNTVNLKIKSPSATYPDLELKCEIGNSIMMVKEMIKNQFPTKPSVSGQKLVYSGKILKDTDILENVLRFEDEVTKFTFHLVCALPQKKTSVPETSGINSFPDGIRQRHTAGDGSGAGSTDNTDMDQMMRDFSNQYSEAMAGMTSNPSDADMAAMQLLYNQYLSVYMQYLQSQAQFTSHQQSSQFFVPDQQQHLNQDVVQGPEADAGAVPDAVPNNAGLVMNAGAAAAGQIQEVPADRQRDLLDWVYVMTRLMFLISVIYFHSSFIRLAFVAGLGFAVYLYQNRIRQAQRLRQNQQQQQQQQQNQRNNPEEVVDEAGNEAGNSDETEEEAAPEADAQDAPSKFAVLVTFMTSLVSSIIPEQPQVI